MNKTTEFWKPIKGYEGIYEISLTTKQVKSLPRMRLSKGGCLCPVKERILKTKTDKDGYTVVSLSNNGKMYYPQLHLLIARTFIPNPKHLPQVNHKDENKQNNSISNLEWCTCKYNVRYSKHKVSHKITYKGKIYPSIRACGRITKIDHHTIRKHLINGTPYNGEYFVRVQ